MLVLLYQEHLYGPFTKKWKILQPAFQLFNSIDCKHIYLFLFQCYTVDISAHDDGLVAVCRQSFHTPTIKCLTQTHIYPALLHTLLSEHTTAIQHQTKRGVCSHTVFKLQGQESGWRGVDVVSGHGGS